MELGYSEQEAINMVNDDQYSLLIECYISY